MPIAHRFDRCELRKDGMEKSPEGYLQGRARVTRTGVFPYRADDGTIHQELRHPLDVFSKASMDTLKSLAMQVEHKAMLNVENTKTLKVGHLGSNPEVDAPYIEIDYKIDTADGVRAVEQEGRRELSCGYEADVVEEKGVFDGQPYTHRQTNIRYNHVAITVEARLGPELRLDSSIPHAVRLDCQPPPEESPMNLKKVKLDTGLEYDAAPEVAVYIDQLRTKLDTAIGDKKKADEENAEELKKLKGEKEKADAERDQAKADAAKAQSDLKALQDSFEDKVRVAVKDRADLSAVAVQVLDEEGQKKLDGMSALDIKKAVIVAYDSEAKLDGKSEEYITARFDAVASSIKKDGSTHLAEAREATAPRQDTGGTRQDANEHPSAKLAKSRQDAWKHPNGKKEG